MNQHRPKLHPSSCFPSNPPASSTHSRLFIRISPTQFRYRRPRLTFIGTNATTYSAIVALLAYQQSTPIEYITLFDIYGQLEARAILNDLQFVSLFKGANTRLKWAQSYWETKDSSIIIINVQHHRLENESISTWTQINASLVENIVSQVCIYSPHATLIICTQPNELMTYVASRVSRFPIERIFGLGASVDTAYVHRTILDQNGKIHGHINGYFVLGNGSINDWCGRILTNNLFINGINCSDIQTKFIMNKTETKNIEHNPMSRKRKPKDWNVVKTLGDNKTVYSNVRRRLPIVTDLTLRQKNAIKYLLPNFALPLSEPNIKESIKLPSNIKLRSNWTEAMLIVHITRAIINGSEFQSNFAVNIAPINNSNDVFINYPTIIGSSNRGIEYMLPSRQAQHILNQRLFLVPYEKLQRKLCFSNQTISFIFI